MQGYNYSMYMYNTIIKNKYNKSKQRYNKIANYAKQKITVNYYFIFTQVIAIMRRYRCSENSNDEQKCTMYIK